MPLRVLRFEEDDEAVVSEPAVRSLTGPGSTDAQAPALIGNSPVVSAVPEAGKGLALNAQAKVPLGAIATKFQTFPDQDATPSVFGATLFKTANTGATSITTFDDGMEGQRILIVFTDSNTTLSEAGNIKLSAAFTSTADDTMELVFDGVSWYEVGRAVN